MELNFIVKNHKEVEEFLLIKYSFDELFKNVTGNRKTKFKYKWSLSFQQLY